MVTALKSFLKSVFGRARLEREMEIEMQSHMARYIEDLTAKGVPREEAERRARAEFGSVQAVKEECREAVGLRWPNELARNFRYAARVLRKSPVFTATAVLTLALCIGAVTAVYSVVDAVLLRPLPYPEPERLAQVAMLQRREGQERLQTNQTGRTWEVVRDHASFVDSAVLGGTAGVNLAVNGRAEYVRQHRVSAGYFRVLGIEPLFGREFYARRRPGWRARRDGSLV